jgi:hypothetical protein
LAERNCSTSDSPGALPIVSSSRTARTKPSRLSRAYSEYPRDTCRPASTATVSQSRCRQERVRPGVPGTQMSSPGGRGLRPRRQRSRQPRTASSRWPA